MGDYSFFIKSTTFILLLNAAIFSFPEEVEALTGGALNTSTVSGTNVSINDPNVAGSAVNEKVDITSSFDFNNVELNEKGDLQLENGTDRGYAKYNISSFEKNSDGFYEVYIEGYFGNNIFGEDNGAAEITVETEQGNDLTFNQTLGGDYVFERVKSDVITVYFTRSVWEQQAVLVKLEDSNNFEHTPDTSLTNQFLEDTGLSGFGDSLQNLISLYTAPSTGNQVLGAIFTIYLLGFIVFLLKEVVPG